MRRLTLPAIAGLAVALLFALPATVIESRAQAPQAQAVPQDLTPLLAKPTSEMRLVVTRYTADRNTLIGHFAGQSGRGGGGGRAGGGGAAGGPAAAPPAAPMPISAARLARLKRYDLDWQAALTKVDATKLSDLAKPDLVSLNTTIANNLKQIEADALTLAQVTPLVPFAPKLVGLIEARIRVDQVEPQKAAGTLMSVVSELKTLRANLDANATEWTKVRAVALNGAQAATQLRSGITEWFNFYNGYDPLFTWWMGMPFKQLDAGLQEHITLPSRQSGEDRCRWPRVARDDSAGHTGTRAEVRLSAGSDRDTCPAAGRVA